MKKLLKIAFATLLLAPITAFAASGANWQYTNPTDGFIKPGLINGAIQGIIVSASSTIGNTTQAGGLTINGGATTTGKLLVSGLITGNGGFFIPAAQGVRVGNIALDFSATGQVTAGSAGTIGFTSSTNGASAAADTAISRFSANVLAIGNGTQGDISGTLLANTLGIGTSTPQMPLSVAVASGASGCTFGFDRASTVGGCISGGNGAFSFNTNSFYQWNAGAGTDYAPSNANGSDMILRNHVLTVGTTTSATSGGHLNIWGRNGAAAYFEVTNADAGDTTPNGDIFMINSSGNVGIGTSTPFAELSVATPNNSNGALQTLFAIASSTQAGATTTLFSINNQGNIVGVGSMNLGNAGMTAGNYVINGQLRYGSSSRIIAPGDGILQLSNNAQTDFTRLDFAFTTNAAPALNRNGTALTVGLADGSLGATFGIGTSTPFGKFAINLDNGETNTRAFNIASSTGSATTTLYYVTNTGHHMTGGSSPSCGTGCSSVSGDDNNFRAITGTGVTAVTVNFANPWINSAGTSITPVCNSSDESGGTTVSDASSTPTSVTMNLSASLTTKMLAVHCEGSDNFTF